MGPFKWCENAAPTAAAAAAAAEEAGDGTYQADVWVDHGWPPFNNLNLSYTLTSWLLSFKLQLEDEDDDELSNVFAAKLRKTLFIDETFN